MRLHSPVSDDGSTMSGINSKHLAKGSTCPQLNPDKITIFNMRYCPYAQRAILVALAKNLE